MEAKRERRKQKDKEHEHEHEHEHGDDDDHEHDKDCPHKIRQTDDSQHAKGTSVGEPSPSS